MSNNGLEYSEFISIEKKALAGRLSAVRAVLRHAGEKGRALEHEVASLLRAFLPNEYGISTGFIAYHTHKGPKLSSQLDIIIYDALRGSPLVNFETCAIFPIEFVFGYIEVKAVLTSSPDTAKKYAENSIEKCIQKNKELRSIRKRKFWIPIPRSQTAVQLIERDWLPIRSYIFAYNGEGKITKDPQAMATRMANFMKLTGQPVHLHGVLLTDGTYFETVPVDSPKANSNDYFHVRYATENTLGMFKASLISALVRFDRIPENWVPAVDQYQAHVCQWQKVSPQ
ncbi:MAG: hypothetical protein KAT48_14570 [Bacteroidales bacterium]|nr:hypothetical protein [Bacteroidales bacterium]